MGWHIGEGGGIIIVYVMSIVKVKHTIKMLMR